MDRISKSLLDEFSSQATLDKLSEDARFEHFAAFLALSRHHGEAFNSSDIVTGAGGDTGIDAIAMLVNGSLVLDPDEVKELAETNGYVDAAFIFVQAERSESFDSGKLQKFGFGGKDFFAEAPRLPRNSHIIAAARTMSEVYGQSSRFKRGKPDCRLYYVTTGRWTGDQNLEAHRAAVLDDLSSLNIFRQVDCSPVDADGIQDLYRQAKNAISREFTFTHRAVVPEMPGIKEAHIGLVSAAEFLSLIDDGSGGILKSLFYDNVRDWQDYNAVNSEIRDTIASSSERARFALMNNGITIIAKNVRATANRFFVEDYQIVNGCQTSHVLFDQRANLDNSVYIPLRLISTDDEEVVAAIVKATNRQTEVKQEQLIALSDFQKKLEGYFVSFDLQRRLFYERRSRQYSSASVEKTRIITPNNLIRGYASMFLMEPHRTTRNYRRLLERVGKDVFGNEHRLEPYYAAAWAWHMLEVFFKYKVVDARYKTARFQVLMAARILANPERPPRVNSHEMSRYAEKISELLWDFEKCFDLFGAAVEVVKSISEGSLDGDTVRTEGFTERLRVAAEQAARQGTKAV